MLDRLRLNKRGLKPSLSNSLTEIDHDQVSGPLLGQLVADSGTGRFNPVGLTGFMVAVNRL